MRFLSALFPSRRASGDRARDRGDWRTAERAYRAHLKRHPEDTAIWVQHGHALMRTGRPGEAALAYRTAYDRTTDDLELLGQLGFALRDAGRRAEARTALLDLHARRPSEETRGEIILLDHLRRDSADVAMSGTIFLSIHDLLGYLKVHPTMSGVQRVQAGIVRHALTASGAPVRFIVNSLSATCDLLPGGTFWMIPTDAVLAIVDYATSATMEPSRLRALILVAEDRAVSVSPGDGSAIVLLGAFWALGNSVRAVAPNRRAGALVAAYFYDIIPITHPHFCDPVLVRDFAMSFCEACALVDVALTISDATRIAIQQFLADHGLRPIPMRTVRLAHRMTAATIRGGWPTELEPPGGRGIVAYVSTIEGRKNHLYVARAWQAMIAAGIAVPDLLFVGRPGWRIDTLTRFLEETRFLDGRIRFIHDVGDAALDAIYAASLFTVFTSFVEGWGLPIGESLVRGTPCIASHTSSMPEVGGALVDYVDPNDVDAGVRLFTRAITDRTWLAERRAAIARDFVPRDWDAVARAFFATLESLANDARTTARRDPAFRLPEAILFDVGALAEPMVDIAAYARTPWRLMLADFYDPDTGGAWLRGDGGAVVIDTDGIEGAEIMVVLALRCEPSHAGRMLAIDVDGMASHRCALREASVSPVRLRARIGPAGAVRIGFALGTVSDPPSQGARKFALGLVAIGYARLSDPATVDRLLRDAAALV